MKLFGWLRGLVRPTTTDVMPQTRASSASIKEILDDEFARIARTFCEINEAARKHRETIARLRTIIRLREDSAPLADELSRWIEKRNEEWTDYEAAGTATNGTLGNFGEHDRRSCVLAWVQFGDRLTYSAVYMRAEDCADPRLETLCFSQEHFTSNADIYAAMNCLRTIGSAEVKA